MLFVKQAVNNARMPPDLLDAGSQIPQRNQVRHGEM
jgi:hypothetical protein